MKIIISNYHTLSKPYFYVTSNINPYPYFDVVVGLMWSHDPKSYAGGSVCYR
jgi:hypothetical protein